MPTGEETMKHPAYASALWDLQPSKKGRLTVGASRGSPATLAWEIHGRGPTKLVLIMGLIGVRTSWQRQTCYFGHDHADEYSVLIFDNRGVGESDKPLGRYTSSGMGRDVVELLDHVGWTADRSVNVAGISMGGMIAQEIACYVPERLASLTLLCTTAAFDSGKTILDRLAQAKSIFSPKSVDDNIADTAKALFPKHWLDEKDESALPSPKTTDSCGPAKGSKDGEYGLFETNFQRFQAHELHKKYENGWVTKTGLFCQLAAVLGHRKSADQLRYMADRIGREKILILHGTSDNMIPVVNGKKLIDMVQPGKSFIVDGMGHVPLFERTKWFNELLEERLKTWAKL